MKKIQQFTKTDMKITNCTELYSGFFKMRQYEFTHKLFKGGWSHSVKREVFERGHAVAVLPYDPVLHEFVLIEQCRIGAFESSVSPWMIEVIAGMVEEGESDIDVCIREAREEANITLSNVEKVSSFIVSPGGCTERITLFIASVDASKAFGIHGLASESEDILVHRVNERTAKNWMKDGTIDNATALIALQWFFLNKDELLSKWCI